jgi:hypothetical protein
MERSVVEGGLSKAAAARQFNITPCEWSYPHGRLANAT